MSKPTYRLLPNGAFVLGQYHDAPPIASFLPGIAGPWGRPLWVFYVNRGQGIASFGLRDKNHAMLEFQSANQAYRLTSTQGFRTFLKLGAGNRQAHYEPFQHTSASIEQEFQVTADALTLRERSTRHGLDIQVRYFTLPNEPVAGLVRVVQLTNRRRQPQTCELLDGLATVVPFGCSDYFLKHMGHTVQAWYLVNNLPWVPVFRLMAEPHDRPETTPIIEGHFYAAWVQQGARRRRALPVLVQPERAFGMTTDLSTPTAFWSARRFRIPQRQSTINQTPMAMAHLRTRLEPGASVDIVSLLGHARNEHAITAYLRHLSSRFFQDKDTENQQLIAALQDRLLTVTGSQTFNWYARQTFLDNLLRGGFPARIGQDEQAPVYYVYGRKHGDLERDYNRFVLEPTPWSQGNANYRDLNQNRRSDGWVEPRALELNLVTFFSLIQLDGFNPLVCTGGQFQVPRPAEAVARAPGALAKATTQALIERLAAPCTPGDLVLWLDDHDVTDRCVQEQVLTTVLAQATWTSTAEHGEGFWTDHWHYCLDLLDSLGELYPDRVRQWLLETPHVTYYDNPHIVRPRHEKYIPHEGTLVQRHAVCLDADKASRIAQRAEHPFCVRARDGQGDIVYTTLAVKLLGLLAVKLASLDPGGVGIEMEAEKPNWYDALNGLPALFGSSVAETFELARGLRWLKETLAQVADLSSETLECPEEVAELCRALHTILETFHQSSATPDRDMQYWEAATTAKEAFRARVRLGVTGKRLAIPLREVDEWITLAWQRVDAGLLHAFDATAQMYRTYFWYEPVAFATDDTVRVTQFRRHALPFFLEGNVHALRYTRDQQQAAALHRAVTRSSLFDKQLKMYKVTTSLLGAPEAIGRARLFTPGWLEHESIWLHMEYKYLLELLRRGLTGEFMRCWRAAGIPHQPAQRYGRSVAESSSFLVSSAYPGARHHGRGFVARLTGATAEFVHFWRLLMIGQQPFHVDADGRLAFTFRPQLPDWLFTTQATTVTFARRDNTQETVTLPPKTVSFLLFGQTLITYHNPARRSTFGARAVHPTDLFIGDEHPWHVAGDTVPAPYAEQLRNAQLRNIQIELT